MCVSVVGGGNFFWSNFGGDRRVAEFWWMVLWGLPERDKKTEKMEMKEKREK